MSGDRSLDAESLLHSLMENVPGAAYDGLGEGMPPAVETALYYAIAEALTNVDRYAAAASVTVHLRRTRDGVEVEVADDGRGGADRTSGTGLRGLEDRLAVVGGVLELESPPGGGTRLRARVPLGAAAPAGDVDAER
jgi:signal transduction histidine kinase